MQVSDNFLMIINEKYFINVYFLRVIWIAINWLPSVLKWLQWSKKLLNTNIIPIDTNI